VNATTTFGTLPVGTTFTLPAYYDAPALTKTSVKGAKAVYGGAKVYAVPAATVVKTVLH
jgi:hypothetical protein